MISNGAGDGSPSSGIRHITDAILHKFHLGERDQNRSSVGSNGNKSNQSSGSNGRPHPQQTLNSDHKMSSIVHDVVEVVANLEKLESNYNYGAHRISLNSLVNNVVIKQTEKQHS